VKTSKEITRGVPVQEDNEGSISLRFLRNTLRIVFVGVCVDAYIHVCIFTPINIHIRIFERLQHISRLTNTISFFRDRARAHISKRGKTNTIS